ncbi:hypothetical protein QE152_g40450 [Popillia japonica]|uniref:Uncharacterized protein n=1 Tax=Popillia japonica TaxID=7064 RepID=A0AAW1HR30_POPJA
MSSSGGTSSSFNTKAANWLGYSEKLEFLFNQSPANMAFEEFISCILEAAKENIPYHKSSFKFNPCPWWDEQCSRMVKLEEVFNEEISCG